MNGNYNRKKKVLGKERRLATKRVSYDWKALKGKCLVKGRNKVKSTQAIFSLKFYQGSFRESITKMSETLSEQKKLMAFTAVYK